MTQKPDLQAGPSRSLLPGLPGLPLILILADFLFWAAIAAAALTVVVAAALHVRKKRKDRALDPDEETRLWKELRQAGPAAAERTFAAGAIREAGSPPVTPRSARDEDRVAALFETLREDQGPQAVPTGTDSRAYTTVPPPAGGYAPAPSGPAVTTAAGPSVGAQLEWPTIRSGLPSLEQALTPGPFDHPGVGDPTPGSVQPWPEDTQDLPSEVRMDVARRLEADLEWAQPQATPQKAWVPDFVRRNQVEAQAREHERLTRQVDLAKALMQAPQPELRKQGVELAYRLELELHDRRNKRVRRTYQK